MTVLHYFKKSLPFVLLFCLLSLLSHQLFSANSHDLPSTLIGEKVPAFELLDMNHLPNTFTNKDLKGKVSLLNIWATWCYACKMEHGMLVKISEQYHIPVYGIAYKDNPDSIQAWLKKKGNPYQKLGSDNNGDIAIDLGIVGTPETFIINEKGEIVYKHIGAINQVTWDNLLYPFIKQLQGDNNA